MIASRTEHEVTCPDCRFRRTFLSMPEARKADAEHRRLHHDFALGTRVLTPVVKGMDPTRPGTIEVIYSEWNEALVTLDEKTECYECRTHSHWLNKTWRGHLSEVALLNGVPK